jgi:hypothetical protein
MSSAKALALPIFRRYWLWNAWEVSGTGAASRAAAASSTTPTSLQATHLETKTWRDGHTLEERFALAGDQLLSKFQRQLSAEWNKLESARDGTFRNRMYRLAQAVLSREDPHETFLKSVPTGHTEMLVLYPGILKEKVVRRRLRLLALQGKRRHRRRIFWWSLAMIPQIPLMVTPLPNITVYYTLYRLYSHIRALQGSKSLEKGFTALDSQQLRSLRDELLRFQASHDNAEFPTDSWTAKLVRKEKSYLDIFERLRLLQKQRRLEAMLQGQEVPSAAALLNANDTHTGPGLDIDRTFDAQGAVIAAQAAEEKENEVEAGIKTGTTSTTTASSAKSQATMNASSSASTDVFSTGMNLKFYGSAELDELVKPEERVKIPLSDEAALKIGQFYNLPHLLEYVARARRRVVGSMFPAHTEEWSNTNSSQKRD